LTEKSRQDLKEKKDIVNFNYSTDEKGNVVKKPKKLNE